MNLAKPRLSPDRAATIIQKTWRGYKSRNTESEHEESLFGGLIKNGNLMRTDCCKTISDKKVLSEWAKRNFEQSRTKNNETLHFMANEAACPFCRDTKTSLVSQLRRKGLFVGKWKTDILFKKEKNVDRKNRLETILSSRTYNLRKRDEVRGFTPLHWAIIQKDTLAIRAILKYISNLDILLIPDNEGITPLCLALTENTDAYNPIFTKAQRLGGATALRQLINAKNKNGATILHYSIFFDADFVKSLIASGADINARDKDGKRPIDLATEYNLSEEILKLLRPK